MTTRRRLPFLAPLFVLALGCGEPPPPETPPGPVGPAVAIPTASAAAPAPVAASPWPVLAPLALDTRPPCDVAEEARKAAALELGQGRAYRAERTIAKADRLCPATAQASWRTRLDALGKLGRDDAARALAKEILAAPSADPAAAADAKAALAKAPPTPQAADVMLAAALAAQKSGAPDARLQLDRALVRVEQETAAAPVALFDAGERRALAISADGSRAVLTEGRAAILVDTADLQPRRFFDHKGTLVAAALLPDGKLLATVQSNGETTVWTVATGKPLHHVVWSGEEPRQAVFSPDGKRLITAGGTHFDVAVRVWNLETGDSVESFSISSAGTATAAALSRDGKLIAIGTDRGVLELWALGPAKRAFTLTKKDSFLEGVTSMDFSPRGDRLVAAMENGDVTVWDTKLGKSVWQVSTGDRSERSAVTFSADGSRFLASGRAGFEAAIQEWDSATGAALQNKPVDLEVEFFSRDGKIGVGAGREAYGVLDVVARTAVTVPVTGKRVRSILFGPPRTLVLGIDSEKALRLVTPKGCRMLPVGDEHGSTALSLDGRVLAHASYRQLAAWDTGKGEQTSAYPALPDGSSRVIAFGPEGAELRTASRRSNVLSVQVASPGKPAWRESFHEERKSARDILLSGYGRFGIIFEEKQVLLADLDQGRARSIQDEGDERIDAVGLSGDGRALFLVRDRQLHRFDTGTGKPTHGPAPLDCYSNAIFSAFDGSRVIASCSEQTVVLGYSAAAEVPTRATLKLGPTFWGTVAVAPHGDLIATANDDGVLRLWTVAGGLRAEIFPLPGADAMLLRAADGRVLPLGRDAQKLDSRLRCRVGSHGLPFSVCADALTDEGLLAEVLSPAP